MSATSLACFAPAKLNLFLHITGRRADGYHLLQTVFQLVDWGDRLRFKLREDGIISRCTPVPGLTEASDLTLRAAHLLQAHTCCPLGVEIEIEKQLPLGAGLGGGSSDAASTLLALNQLWQLGLSRVQLQTLALSLGADVPFFVFGRPAFAEGIGEQLQAVDLPRRYFLIIVPNVHVSSAEIFSSQELTRQTKNIKMTSFLRLRCHPQWPDDFGRNDMQAVVAKKHAEVKQVLDWFKEVALARMTGSGSSVFAAFRSEEEALAAQARVPIGWRSVVAASLERHPLFDFAE